MNIFRAAHLHKCPGGRRGAMGEPETDKPETAYHWLYYDFYGSGLWDTSRRSGKLKHLNKFDASFFGFHSRQAYQTDLQLRILLEIQGETYALPYLKFWRIGALSEVGKNRAFDADGKGFDRSEEVTAIYIERMGWEELEKLCPKPIQPCKFHISAICESHWLIIALKYYIVNDILLLEDRGT
uniref:Uncharacterized protein n=1 Tax=Strigamia maritima TaxID=126957 RepID=T1IKF3_STRMM